MCGLRGRCVTVPRPCVARCLSRQLRHKAILKALPCLMGKYYNNHLCLFESISFHFILLFVWFIDRWTINHTHTIDMNITVTVKWMPKQAQYHGSKKQWVTVIDGWLWSTRLLNEVLNALRIANTIALNGLMVCCWYVFVLNDNCQ